MLRRGRRNDLKFCEIECYNYIDDCGRRRENAICPKDSPTDEALEGVTRCGLRDL